MPTLASSYGRGASQTSTSGVPMAIGGMDPELLAIAKQVLNAKLGEYRRSTAPAAPAFGYTTTPDAGAGAPVRTASPPPRVMGAADNLQLQAQRLALSEGLARHRARSQAAPVKMVGLGPQGIPGYMPDPDRMSGYEREVFLPDQAALQPSADEDARAKAGLARELRFQSTFGTPRY